MKLRNILFFIFVIVMAPAVFAAPKYAKATFAGGCFWCMEPPFEKLPGVLSVTSGYTAGKTKNPTYEQVSNGGTGHAEAVQILFDPTKVTYAELLQVFWHNVDPLQADGQFCDHGDQYRSGIYYHDADQKQLAEKSKMDASRKLGRPIVTEILAATEFYIAEDYHQDYYKKNPIRYNTYKTGCGRDRRLQELWGTK